jgi:hypothetical protein
VAEIAAPKRAAKKIAEAGCAQKENSRIETETWRAKEAARKDRDLKRILCFNTSGEAICDESSFEETIHAMKRVIILGSALSVVALMLVSCASEPAATTTTTRQTTVTTPVAPPSQTTTTTTQRMGGGY